MQNSLVFNFELCQACMQLLAFFLMCLCKTVEHKSMLTFPNQFVFCYRVRVIVMIVLTGEKGKHAYTVSVTIFVAFAEKVSFIILCRLLLFFGRFISESIDNIIRDPL